MTQLRCGGLLVAAWTACWIFCMILQRCVYILLVVAACCLSLNLPEPLQPSHPCRHAGGLGRAVLAAAAGAPPAAYCEWAARPALPHAGESRGLGELARVHHSCPWPSTCSQELAEDAVHGFSAVGNKSAAAHPPHPNPPLGQGLELALESVRAAYSSLGAPDLFQLYVEPGCGHECTEGMWQQVRTGAGRAPAGVAWRLGSSLAGAQRRARLPWEASHLGLPSKRHVAALFALRAGVCLHGPALAAQPAGVVCWKECGWWLPAGPHQLRVVHPCTLQCWPDDVLDAAGPLNSCNSVHGVFVESKEGGELQPGCCCPSSVVPTGSTLQQPVIACKTSGTPGWDSKERLKRKCAALWAGAHGRDSGHTCPWTLRDACEY